MNDLFNEKNVVKALESLFIQDRFVQWTGSLTPELFKFLNKSGFDGDKLKIYKDDGYYVVPVGSWLVKAPDGSIHAFGKGVRFVSKFDEEMIDNLQKKIDEIEIPIHVTEKEEPITTFIPEDIFETEVVDDGNGISLRRKLDENGNPILKKNRLGCQANPNCAWKEKFIQEVDKWKK